MTRAKFYAKHNKSVQEAMQSIMGLVSVMGDLRTCAERSAAKKDASGEMAETARQLDVCCACLVRLIAKIPVEILMSIYDYKTLTKQEAV